MSLITGALVSVVVWWLVSGPLSRWGIHAPLFLALAGMVSTAAGMVLTAGSGEWLSALIDVLNGHSTAKAVEIVLAILLFMDAIEVRGGLFGGEGRVTLRLLLIALPLSIIATLVLGWTMVPGVSFFTLVIVACVIMPTDFATSHGIIKSAYLPQRVKTILNVESGYNDGLISPIFSMSLALALVMNATSGLGEGATAEEVYETPGVSEQLQKSVAAFINAVPATIFAIAIGVALGLAAASLVRLARNRGWMAASGERVVILVMPVIAFLVSTIHAVGANGFVAAFVAGVGYHLARYSRNARSAGREITGRDLALIEQVSALLAYIVWYVVGAVTVLVLYLGMSWRVFAVALLGLTVLRILPVMVSLLGSSLTWKERWAVACLGPRGVATVVFGLLAYNALPGGEGLAVLTATVVAVVGSIVAYGYAAPAWLHRRDPFGLRPDPARGRLGSGGPPASETLGEGRISADDLGPEL